MATGEVELGSGEVDAEDLVTEFDQPARYGDAGAAAHIEHVGRRPQPRIQRVEECDIGPVDRTCLKVGLRCLLVALPYQLPPIVVDAPHAAILRTSSDLQVSSSDPALPEADPASEQPFPTAKCRLHAPRRGAHPSEITQGLSDPERCRRRGTQLRGMMPPKTAASWVLGGEGMR
jgi:hypothetical protein